MSAAEEDATPGGAEPVGSTSWTTGWEGGVVRAGAAGDVVGRGWAVLGTDSDCGREGGTLKAAVAEGEGSPEGGFVGLIFGGLPRGLPRGLPTRAVEAAPAGAEANGSW